jgi:hypothetical protein
VFALSRKREAIPAPRFIPFLFTLSGLIPSGAGLFSFFPQPLEGINP